MDREYRNKKIVDLTDQELITLGFLGDDALPGIRDMVQKVRADPGRLGPVNCFQIDCLRRKYAAPEAPAQNPVGSKPT